VERQVVAEHQEALGPPGDEIGDRRQVDQVVLLDLDEAQRLLVVLVEQALDDGGLAGAPRAGEQHVVRRPALQELAGVLLHLGDLRPDPLQVGKAHAVHVAHRLKPPARIDPGGLAPAVGDARRPVGRRRPRRQQLLEALQQRLQVLAHDRYSALIFTYS
jgi:hypothetical protein